MASAPGNKTTHLAAHVGSRGRVHAFDADAFRLKRLKANSRTAGADKIVKARCEDFLSLDPKSPEFAGVRAVLLDPSCSGSGTAGTRGDYLLAAARGEVVGGGDGDGGGGGDGDEERLKHPNADDRVAKLAQFQARALAHALTFPSAVRRTRRRGVEKNRKTKQMHAAIKIYLLYTLSLYQHSQPHTYIFVVK